MRVCTLACAVSVLLLPVWAWAANRDLLIADISSPIIQNKRADHDNLSRMRNTAMIRRFVKHGYLVHVPSSTRYYYLHSIPHAFHYCRPWTRTFIRRLSREFYAKFDHRLRVTSLVRTVVSQKKLARRNGNAANAFGPLRSSHLTGATVDISKRFMSEKGKDWMRRVLYSIRDKGYLYAIEEFQEPTFHIMVFENYPQYVKLLAASR